LWIVVNDWYRKHATKNTLQLDNLQWNFNCAGTCWQQLAKPMENVPTRTTAVQFVVDKW
jgi:hypothetical protein